MLTFHQEETLASLCLREPEPKVVGWDTEEPGPIVVVEHELRVIKVMGGMEILGPAKPYYNLSGVFTSSDRAGSLFPA